MMLEMVAVGAIAMQFELRMPCRATRSRSASQSSVAERSTLDVAAARVGEQLERVDAAGCPRLHSEPANDA